MAGTFYRSPAPGEAPFVKEGDKVKKGQTVGIIEAMKLMNEIEVSGLGMVGGAEALENMLCDGQHNHPHGPGLCMHGPCVGSCGCA